MDVLRGIAAFTVALHHVSIIAGGGGMRLVPLLAVDLFFAISGYVMARTYEKRLLRDLSAICFVRLRYRRLFLPLATGTTLGLILRLSAVHLTPSLAAAYVLALGFLPAFWLGSAFIFNVPAWSLFLEIVANGLHGAIFARLSAATLVLIMAVCAFATAALLSVGLASWQYGIGPIISCLPRELAFYLGGILLFRTSGDRLFGRVNGRWAFWLGAISYPLYATHVPILKIAMRSGLSPVAAFAVALVLACVSAAVSELRRGLFLDRAADHPALVRRRSAR